VLVMDELETISLVVGQRRLTPIESSSPSNSKVPCPRFTAWSRPTSNRTAEPLLEAHQRRVFGPLQT